MCCPGDGQHHSTAQHNTSHGHSRGRPRADPRPAGLPTSPIVPSTSTSTHTSACCLFPNTFLRSLVCTHTTHPLRPSSVYPSSLDTTRQPLSASLPLFRPKLKLSSSSPATPPPSPTRPSLSILSSASPSALMQPSSVVGLGEHQERPLMLYVRDCVVSTLFQLEQSDAVERDLHLRLQQLPQTLAGWSDDDLVRTGAALTDAELLLRAKPHPSHPEHRRERVTTVCNSLQDILNGHPPSNAAEDKEQKGASQSFSSAAAAASTASNALDTVLGALTSTAAKQVAATVAQVAGDVAGAVAVGKAAVTLVKALASLYSAYHQTPVEAHRLLVSLNRFHIQLVHNEQVYTLHSLIATLFLRQHRQLLGSCKAQLTRTLAHSKAAALLKSDAEALRQLAEKLDVSREMLSAQLTHMTHQLNTLVGRTPAQQLRAMPHSTEEYKLDSPTLEDQVYTDVSGGSFPPSIAPPLLLSAHSSAHPSPLTCAILPAAARRCAAGATFRRRMARNATRWPWCYRRSIICYRSC